MKGKRSGAVIAPDQAAFVIDQDGRVSLILPVRTSMLLCLRVIAFFWQSPCASTLTRDGSTN